MHYLSNKPVGRLRKEDEMTDMAQHQHCTRAWYMRPPVWVLGLIVVALIVFGVVESLGRPAATPYSSFLDQLDAGNVASVTFQGTQIDGRFKHPVASTASNGSAQQNAFRSRVPEFGDPSLLPELRKQHVAIDVVSSSNWTSWLSRLPWPMVVFLAFILIAGLVRLMRGGSAQSGSATPVHPMQGMIGLLSGLFGKQSQAAGPATRDGQGSKSG
jgi:ATP-dependent Zn protease